MCLPSVRRESLFRHDEKTVSNFVRAPDLALEEVQIEATQSDLELRLE